jgi:hypothetical protein
MAKTLTRTSIAVTINGNDYSEYVMFPFKVSNLLDEQLDEASLTLIGVPEKNFKPLTDVTITLTNVLETQIYHMLVASDKADEIPSGSGKYKHELYLIEQTKYLECFIVRSIGYLNPLEKSYEQAPLVPYIKMISNTPGTNTPPEPTVKATINGPLYINSEVVFPSLKTLLAIPSSDEYLYISSTIEFLYNRQILGRVGGLNTDFSKTVNTSGTHELVYKFTTYYDYKGNGVNRTTEWEIRYFIAVL